MDVGTLVILIASIATCWCDEMRLNQFDSGNHSHTIPRHSWVFFLQGLLGWEERCQFEGGWAYNHPIGQYISGI